MYAIKPRQPRRGEEDRAKENRNFPLGGCMSLTGQSLHFSISSQSILLTLLDILRPHSVLEHLSTLYQSFQSASSSSSSFSSSTTTSTISQAYLFRCAAWRSYHVKHILKHLRKIFIQRRMPSCGVRREVACRKLQSSALLLRKSVPWKREHATQKASF